MCPPSQWPSLPATGSLGHQAFLSLLVICCINYHETGTSDKILFIFQARWTPRVSIAGFSASRSFVTCIQGVGWTGVISTLNWERIHFQTRMCVAGFSSSKVVELRASAAGWLLTGVGPWFLATWTLATWQLVLSKHVS